MASKKYLLFLAAAFCLTLNTFSQAKIGTSYDSTHIPTKRMPQHNEFLQGTQNFPAKPRNQWELGLKFGTFNVSGDIPSQFTIPSFGVHVRKAFGYVFSMRLEYMYGTGRGRTFNQAANFWNNPSWTRNLGGQGYFAPTRQTTSTGDLVYSNGTSNGPSGEPVYYNYKTKAQDLSLQGVITLNNVRFHKSKTGFNVYGFVGLGATVYDTKINALNGNGQKYDFSTIRTTDVYKKRKDTYKELDNLLDDSYETAAENQGTRRPKLFGKTLRPSGTLGIGMAFKLSNRFNLAIESRQTFIKDDLLDGQRWQEHAFGDASLTRDFDSYNYSTIGLNINLGAKSVEPLWWLNPLDYAYQEIRKPTHMILPKPILPDSDGDGVTDQFDQEQTPAGCAVDTHGVSRDTDGDGVPDCKDKELVTPTTCQPVDADGVGKCPVPCPAPECLEGLIVKGNCETKLGALPSASFKVGSNSLSDDTKAVLATVASKMRNNPECKVVVTGYCASNKKEQQLSWDHVNKVISYLVEKEGISADRFVFNYGQEGGDCNTVDLRGATDADNGPNTVPAPHPNLKKK